MEKGAQRVVKLLMEKIPDSFFLLAIAVAMLVFLGYLLFRPTKTTERNKTASPADPGDTAAYLEDLDNSTHQERYQVSAQKPVLLGRTRGQDSSKQYITILVPTVGRQHAMIQYSGNQYWLVDKGSRNGSFINGQRVSGKSPLKHGDVIKIYKYAFRFVLPQQEADAATVLADDMETTQLAPAEPAPSPAQAAVAAQDKPASADDIDFLLDGGGEQEEEDITLENFIEDASIVGNNPRQQGKG